MTEKVDKMAQYGCERADIEAALAALPADAALTLIQGEDYHVEYVGMPDDPREALREFNRRVNDGDTLDAVVTDPSRPDDPR